MKTIKLRSSGFKITVPDDWKLIGGGCLFFGAISPEIQSAPEIIGSNGEYIGFSIGPIYPVPDYISHQSNIRNISRRHGHTVIDVSDIEIFGENHATIHYQQPSRHGGYISAKNYHIIFNGTEFVATAKLSSVTASCA